MEILRKDYTPPDYWIREVKLDVRIFDRQTKVGARLHVERRDGADADSDLVLSGDGLRLTRLVIDGTEVPESGYKVEAERLVVSGSSLPGAEFWLETEVEVVPEDNTQLSGLYYSGTMYCTQMEAEGFRRFTYFLDRPDNMARFTEVRLEADKSSCPILLSNGNRLEAGDLDGGRHYSVWSDPFPKPSYLFALVAGDLGSIKDTFVTMSGRTVDLEVFSAKSDIDKLGHAMRSLQKAMKWDEDRFGLEYDLDIYNIVAVGDFNMGAMENKSLNIFNTSLTLARPDTATDDDYESIEGVIAHEYFHNWTGNRVTCRDWFQLTLKEGLTVYRDQEFSADVQSRARKRIEDVQILRAFQFPQDAGPMAHSIRPEKYAAIDNFYTATVYNKGAEVIRMYETLLGRDGFRKGMDLYFKRHDGSAVTCDDFRAAMADANGRDLAQFERWYLQAGTPTVTVEGSWDAEKKTYTLSLAQTVPDTPGQKNKLPMHIPVRVGLLDRSTGKEVLGDTLVELTESSQTFELQVSADVSEPPVPSLLRDFSAPVVLQYPYTEEELALLAGNDTDSFNRWEAMQRLGTKAVLDAYQASEVEGYSPSPAFVEAMRRTVTDTSTEDLSLLAYALALPPYSTLLEIAQPPIDPLRLHEARNHIRKVLGSELREEFMARYTELSPKEGEEYAVDGPSSSRRRLRHVCLAYLMTEKSAETTALCYRHYENAGGMTEKATALSHLCGLPEDTPERRKALESFYTDAKGDANVLDKWFGMQAGADTEDLLPRVKALMEHPDFTLKTPNRLRAVARNYLRSPRFHQGEGDGYTFAADLIMKVDPINKQMAAGLAGAAFQPWRRLNAERQSLIKTQLDRLKAAPLSKDASEIVTKTRGDD